MSWNRRPKQDLSGQPEQIYPAALAYLTRRDYSRGELMTKLLSRGADEDEAEQALDRLVEQGYLNERRMAEGRIRERRQYSRRSRLAVRQELRQAELDEELIDELMEEHYTPQQESELISSMIESELRRWSVGLSQDEKREKFRSLSRRLLSRGFPGSEIRCCIERQIRMNISEENEIL